MDFHAAETERLALQKACDLLEVDIKTSRLAKIGIHRKSARTAANEVMQLATPQNFSDLQSLIVVMEGKLSANQAKVNTL